MSLLHEIHVYREEMLAQNEEFAGTRDQLERARDRFMELYDFAPSAYLTLDANGNITQINLMGAQMLGQPRQRLEGRSLLSFISPAARGRYLEFLRLCRAGTVAAGTQINVEVMLMTSGKQRDVQIVCSPGPDAAIAVKSELLACIIDIAERRQLESERERIAREHAALASRLLSAQDEERQRIARDLHDNVGQQVTALRLILQITQANANKDDVRGRLDQAQTIVDQLDRQLDFIAAELRPASLDLGVTSAVKHFVREWSMMFGIRIECICRGLDDLRLNKDVETHVYRVLQESLNNVYKHARASRVDVLLEARTAEIELTVRDNGRGFDSGAHQREHPRGLGLLGMRERAQLVGGSLKIQSAPARGTTVALRVPIAGRTESR